MRKILAALAFGLILHGAALAQDKPHHGGHLRVGFTLEPTSLDPIAVQKRAFALNFGNFSSAGNLVMLAAGANAVLVPGKLELGAVYITPIATQRNFDLDGLIVKLLYRY